MLQAETLAQAAERGGKKVAQIEWAGGRSAAIQGPTLDFRNFRSVRGVTTNYTSPADIPANITAFGVQYDKIDPVPATGWTGVPQSFSPAKEMHMAVRDTLAATGIDKYGLNAYIYDSKNDHKARYDRVLFSRTKSGADAVANLKEGELADVKVKISRHAGRRARRQDRRDARQGRAPRAGPVAGAAVPHVGDARDRDVAELDRRAGLHRQLRGLRGRALPVLAGR